MPSKPEPPHAYELLRPVMMANGATCTPKEFYWHVNEAFHTVEASSYDEIHAGMFAGSDPMWSRLLKSAPDGNWNVLDVGSGTGLVGEHLVRLASGRVHRLTMLDPNDAMLDRSRVRSRNWPEFAGGTEFLKGDISAVEGRSFDLITVSSVFHHVVEIEQFGLSLNRLLRPGGSLLQMQDPRSGGNIDTVLSRRSEATRSKRPTTLYRRARAVGGKVLRAFGRKSRGDPVAEATNVRLMAAGIINRPLDMPTIWAITDFHVPGQPHQMGQGFALAQMHQWLSLDLIDSFTYQFQGLPWDLLSRAERLNEEKWWRNGDEHGALFGSAWRKS